MNYELNKELHKEESIESKYRVNRVESGLPRWLIEAAFVCYLLQAAINWSPLMHWMETHALWASAVIHYDICLGAEKGTCRINIEEE